MIFFLFCLFTLIMGIFPAWSQSASVEPGKLIVQFQPDAISSIETQLKSFNLSASDTSGLKIGIKSLDKINKTFKATNMRRLFPDAGKYEKKHRKYGLHLWYEIILPEDENPEEAAKIYGSDEHILISEPRYKIRRYSMPSPAQAEEVSNDPYFSLQWNYHNTGQTGGVAGADIRLPEAWEAVKTFGIKNRDVIVAVVDGGVYYDHEDLRGNMWVNERELNGTPDVDDDGNGYVDDIYGYNFVRRGRTAIGTIEPEDHATHVAGTVAAVTNNRTGVAGISGDPEQGYGIKVMNVQIMNASTSVSSIYDAFVYAADNGAVISQNSWGYENPNTYNQSDVTAINYFINEAGRDENGDPRSGTPMTGGIVIFAAGNDARDAKWYPGYFDNVIAVAATNHYGKLSWYSNYGSWIDISAPGGDTDEKLNGYKEKAGGIYSTSWHSANNNYYEYMQGTSMACPHVSGVAALILSVYGNENFTPDMLRARLLNTATPLTGFDPGNASKMGAGLLNAANALASGGIPEKVTDLEAVTLNHISGQLTWTSPAVSNDGKITSYTVACAETELTEENFGLYAAAAIATHAEPNTPQTHTVSGLKPSTRYYVAIRNIGTLGDRSEISNIGTFTTNANREPEIIKAMPEVMLIPLTNATIIDLTGYISDPDGDELSYTSVIGSTDIIQAVIQGNQLRINPREYGFSTVELTASDPYGGTVKISFNVRVERKDKLFIYPNPVRDHLYYSFILDGAASVSFRVVNSIGQVLYHTTSISYESGTYYDHIDLSGLSPGMYFLQYIRNGSPADTKKIIKQ